MGVTFFYEPQICLGFSVSNLEYSKTFFFRTCPNLDIIRIYVGFPFQSSYGQRIYQDYKLIFIFV